MPRTNPLPLIWVCSQPMPIPRHLTLPLYVWHALPMSKGKWALHLQLYLRNQPRTTTIGSSVPEGCRHFFQHKRHAVACKHHKKCVFPNTGLMNEKYPKFQLCQSTWNLIFPGHFQVGWYRIKQCYRNLSYFGNIISHSWNSSCHLYADNFKLDISWYRVV